MKNTKVLWGLGVLLFLAAGLLLYKNLTPEQKKLDEISETQLFSMAQQTAKRQGCQEALGLFDELLKRDPLHFSAYEQKADCLIKLQRYPEALESLEKAATQNPQKYQSKMEFLKNKINPQAE